MKEIKRDNAVIDYQVTGSGDITLLFVHGSYNDQAYWKKQVEYFKNNYTVVTLDLPGHGRSGKDRKRWTIEGFAKDVEAVITELNLKNVVLIGHSMGAGIALMVATSFPEPLSGFIAIDYFKNAATPMMPDYKQQAASIEEKLKTDFANTNEQYARMALFTKQTPGKITDKVTGDYRNAYKPMAVQTTPAIFTIFESEKELLPKLKFKLYLINVDYMPTNEEPLKQYAGSGYEVLHMKGTSHFPMLEDPDGLNRLLEQAIQKVCKV
jgi:sigma-B regulation protein RsbQ